MKKNNFSALITLFAVSASTAGLSLLGAALNPEKTLDLSALLPTLAAIASLTWTAYAWIGWMEQRAHGYLGGVVVGTAAIYATLFQRPIGWPEISLLIPALLTLSYAFPLQLRQGRGLKIHLIVLSWTWTIVALSPHLWDRWWLHGAWIYATVFAMTVPFDIRDVNEDAESLGTIPQKRGSAGSKWLAWASVLFVEATLLIQWGFGQARISGVLVLWGMCEVLSFLIYRVHPRASNGYYYLIDALPALAAAIYVGIFLILGL